MTERKAEHHTAIALRHIDNDPRFAAPIVHVQNIVLYALIAAQKLMGPDFDPNAHFHFDFQRPVVGNVLIRERTSFEPEHTLAIFGFAQSSYSSRRYFEAIPHEAFGFHSVSQEHVNLSRELNFDNFRFRLLSPGIRHFLDKIDLDHMILVKKLSFNGMGALKASPTFQLLQCVGDERPFFTTVSDNPDLSITYLSLPQGSLNRVIRRSLALFG